MHIPPYIFICCFMYCCTCSRPGYARNISHWTLRNTQSFHCFDIASIMGIVHVRQPRTLSNTKLCECCTLHQFDMVVTFNLQDMDIEVTSPQVSCRTRFIILNYLFFLYKYYKQEWMNIKSMTVSWYKINIMKATTRYHVINRKRWLFDIQLKKIKSWRITNR